MATGFMDVWGTETFETVQEKVAEARQETGFTYADPDSWEAPTEEKNYWRVQFWF